LQRLPEDHVRETERRSVMELAMNDPFDDETLAPKTLPLAPHVAALIGEREGRPPIPSRSVDANEVVRCVCQSYMVSPALLLSKDRHKGVAEARQVAYWLFRTLSKMSYPEIGRALGNRDHTSVMSGVRRCLRMREEDRSFEAFTDELAAAVSARLKGDGA
jgi:chromosomal replication initiation ATPase DnaA